MATLQGSTSYELFDTETYYKTYRAPLTSHTNISQILRFVTDSFHNVFSTGSISGDRLLDVGTGASLISFISASRYVKEIHLSDLLLRHRNLLKRWLEGEDRENDIVEYILAKENNGTTLTNRLTGLRRKVTDILHIDVTQKQPLKEPMIQYDVITSTFCLEVAVGSTLEYKQAVENIATLVKRGGYVVLAGTLGERFYIVSGIKFWTACLTETDVKVALTAAGLSLVCWKTMGNNQGLYTGINDMSNVENFFVVVAQKKP